MKQLARILPAVAVIVAVGAAIYHVRSQAAERPAAFEIKPGTPATAQQSLVPPSDRYASTNH